MLIYGIMERPKSTKKTPSGNANYWLPKGVSYY